MLRITVLTGGSTPERDVALAGAAQVVTALRGLGHDVTVVDTAGGALSSAREADLLVSAVAKTPPTPVALADLASRELGDRLTELPEIAGADLVFPVLHGRQGEGGEIQATLEAAGIPYAGSGPAGSTLAMDKDRAKSRFREAQVATPDWRTWPATEADLLPLGFPLVVKPSKVGSSVGLTVVESAAGIAAAIAIALEFDDQVILERFLPGREFTVGVLGDRALAVGEIIPSHEIFDYECKYTPGMTQEIFPADTPTDLAAEMQVLSVTAHRSLGLRDFSRVDFRLDGDDRPSCLEVNTLPGLTATSLLPQSAAAVGIPFAELCDRICTLALERTRPRNKVEAEGM